MVKTDLLNDELADRWSDDPAALDAVINVRLKRSEKAQLREEARRAGLSLSAWVRRRCLGRKVMENTGVTVIRDLLQLNALLAQFSEEFPGKNAPSVGEWTRVLRRELGMLIERWSVPPSVDR